MKIRTLLVLALVLLAGCSDGPSEPGAQGSSAISFAYSGPEAGSLAVAQDCARHLPPLEQTCVHGLRYGNPAGREINAYTAAATGTDWVHLAVPGSGTGTWTIDPGTCPGWDEACPSLFVVLDLPRTGSGAGRLSCSMEAGTIRVESASETRVRGAFSGSGSCMTDAGEVVDGFTVTAGQFDVRLTAGTRG
jgi:hypothetical protein